MRSTKRGVEADTPDLVALTPAEIRRLLAAELNWSRWRPVEKRESENLHPRTFPDWGITDISIGTSQSEVHRGDCFAAGKQLRAISREQALAALGDGIQACEVCRPDLVLGAL
ncbi:DUF6233 domain-containing protein (plasmid) [Streptomyces sp. NBC_00841]|nr:DUF6233 domain-containing protein [Streptomyces sp. NBC_00841]MCX4538691.1 DUF6233 domain-containing protein [Streptomyces sp. NBC_01669]WSA05919.1 DUF6233 domain-containing protein [Streptomyces sp. NBC_00841]